ncbi:RNA polymerase factor sigma-54 [Pseudoxanthomonas wuyuanensis]|uniref:RNA polymerase sigma-54 factor n=1 Tax=Pseudoxanthomonas wuyuanensis TaxID=1073196 RepID=A0A286CZX2_9GAMM|nr:RNA polymerase factor sigma-54 [Pseudoxanthomonas wuyuanensis]KAF1722424.1 RNA polymerase sigma-54 factor [Pseudoxanthomonas wuyuanensis]SOD51960.1 RNA polymerase, sigma 54 subunit, RpoN/SigL [Pseudoxanthomonas wuyuanensis]
MKAGLAAQLGQQLHLTPQLLQSIRLLQLDGMQLELEIRRALELNPALELDESQLADADSPAPETATAEAAAQDVAAFDELPESSLWDMPAASWGDGDDDRMQHLPAGESSDPQVRALSSLALELSESELAVAAFWLEHTDDSGYLQQEPASLALIAAAQFGISAARAEALRQRIVHGEFAGLAARDLRECLLAQLDALPGRVPARAVARRLLGECLELLGAHDYEAIAAQLDLDGELVREGLRLILSLQPRPGEALTAEASSYIVPDVVAWHADCAWRVALNPATAPRLSVSPSYERGLEQAGADAASQKLRELLQEARWLTRGLSMRYDTLLRTARAIVERQAGFLAHGDEAMAPLTLKEIADEIGMHESTVSRITSGKYMQTPRGTFELKHFFAVRLEGASVSGAAVKAMVRRLIDSEPAGRPLADEAIAGLLARQGVHIARRTVAKYREQLDIAPARQRRRVNVTVLAKAG